MSNTIRPKVSDALKQIASADRTGNSKSKIDTKNEFKALQDYLSGNYEELNTTEKNTINRLLDNAKDYLKNTLGNEDQTNIIPNGDDDSITSKYDDSNVDQNNEIADDMKSNGDDETITSKNDDSNVDQYNEITDNMKSNGDDETITSKNDDSNVDQYNEITDDIKPNGDDETITSKNEYDDINQNISEPEANDNNDDFFDNMTNELEKEIQEDTTGIENTYIHQNKMPGKKVMHNGQMCIEMPNGHLYNMQGRRIK